MYWAAQNEIYFVEGEVEGFREIAPISTELNGYFSQNQLKSLADIKSVMATQAKEARGNAICDFRYGQQSTFFKSVFGMDDVRWYASGVIGVIDPKRLPPRSG